MGSEQTPEKQREHVSRAAYQYQYPRSPEPSKIEKSSSGQLFPTLPTSPEPSKVICTTPLPQAPYPTKNTFIQFDTPKKVNLLRSPPKSVPHNFAPSARGLMPGVPQQFPQALPMPSAGGPPPEANMQTLRLSDYLSSPYVQKRQQSLVTNPWPITENPENFPPVPPLPNTASPTFLVFDPSVAGFSGDGSPFGGQMCVPSPMGDGMPFGMGGFAMGEDTSCMGMSSDIPCTPCSGPNGMNDWQQPPQVMGNGNGMNNMGNGSTMNNMGNGSTMNNGGMNSNGMNNNGPVNGHNGNNNNGSSQNIFEALSAVMPNSKISIQSGSQNSNSSNNAGLPSGSSGGYSHRTQRHGSSRDLRHHGASNDQSDGGSSSPNKWRKNRGHHGRH